MDVPLMLTYWLLVLAMAVRLQAEERAEETSVPGETTSGLMRPPEAGPRLLLPFRPLMSSLAYPIPALRVRELPTVMRFFAPEGSPRVLGRPPLLLAANTMASGSCAVVAALASRTSRSYTASRAA